MRSEAPAQVGTGGLSFPLRVVFSRVALKSWIFLLYCGVSMLCVVACAYIPRDSEAPDNWSPENMIDSCDVVILGRLLQNEIAMEWTTDYGGNTSITYLVRDVYEALEVFKGPSIKGALCLWRLRTDRPSDEYPLEITHGMELLVYGRLAKSDHVADSIVLPQLVAMQVGREALDAYPIQLRRVYEASQVVADRIKADSLLIAELVLSSNCEYNLYLNDGHRAFLNYLNESLFYHESESGKYKYPDRGEYLESLRGLSR